MADYVKLICDLVDQRNRYEAALVRIAAPTFGADDYCPDPLAEKESIAKQALRASDATLPSDYCFCEAWPIRPTVVGDRTYCGACGLPRAPVPDPVPPSRDGFMCKIDFSCELGSATGGIPVYASLNDLHQSRGCLDECGIVKVKVSPLEVVQPSNFEFAAENAPSRPGPQLYTCGICGVNRPAGSWCDRSDCEGVGYADKDPPDVPVDASSIAADTQHPEDVFAKTQPMPAKSPADDLNWGGPSTSSAAQGCRRTCLRRARHDAPRREYR